LCLQSAIKKQQFLLPEQLRSRSRNSSYSMLEAVHPLVPPLPPIISMVWSQAMELCNPLKNLRSGLTIFDRGYYSLRARHRDHMHCKKLLHFGGTCFSSSVGNTKISVIYHGNFRYLQYNVHLYSISNVPDSTDFRSDPDPPPW